MVEILGDRNGSVEIHSDRRGEWRCIVTEGGDTW